MQPDHGYAREADLKGTYDAALLRELYPHIRPHLRTILLSAFLALLMTLTSLAMPYVTKIAVDRYIVPSPSVQDRQGEAPAAGSERRLSVELSSPEAREIVRRSPERFAVHGDTAEIPLSETGRLSREEIRVLRQRDLTGVGIAAAAFLLLALIEFLLNFLQMIVMEIAGQKIMHDLRMRLFRHIQGLPLSFFNRTPVARLVTRTTNDIQNMHEFFTSVIVFVFRDVFLLVGIAAVMTGIHWRLSLVCFAILPFVLVAAAFFSGMAREAFRTLRIKTAEINTRFSETIAGMTVLQMFGEEKNADRAFRTLDEEFYRAGMRQIHIFAVFMPLIEFFSAVSLALVIYSGGIGVLGEEISLGVLVAFISYMRMFFRPIRDLSEKYNILQNALSSAERILLLLNVRDEGDPPRAVLRTQPPAAIASLSFENVSMSYVENEPVLRDVSFRMTQNQTVAVVGPTGSGKTTLIHLILRLYEPTSGCIRINGEDIRGWAPEALRARMAVVPQDPFLFSESIRENIRLGNPDLPPEELARAIEAANLGPLIRRLPGGLDTPFGEGGMSISAGERQLVAIARALARDPDLILLDEATSHIDSETELRIQEALSNLLRGRTAMIVAHRLSTARHADRIIVLENGRIIESGSHDELMAMGRVYCKLNRLQHEEDRAAVPGAGPDDPAREPAI